MSELCCLVSAGVHGLSQNNQRVVRLGEDTATLSNVVAVQAHNQGLGCCVAQNLQSLHNAVDVYKRQFLENGEGNI